MHARALHLAGFGGLAFGLILGVGCFTRLLLAGALLRLLLTLLAFLVAGFGLRVGIAAFLACLSRLDLLALLLFALADVAAALFGLLVALHLVELEFATAQRGVLRAGLRAHRAQAGIHHKILVAGRLFLAQPLLHGGALLLDLRALGITRGLHPLGRFFGLRIGSRSGGQGHATQAGKL
ncbi:hypothetical protein SDC9_120908 [bioreactor metagenome]|uniref:Uncharacterized protein n=1 Tax=bioreactor metagenome TaxID=1076179 RepID=A0A645CAH0_9ZZZZ